MTQSTFKLRALSRMLSILLVCVLLAACTGNPQSTNAPAQTQAPATQTQAPATSTQAPSTGDDAPVADGITYPLAPTTLTINRETNPYDTSAFEPSMVEYAAWNEYQERTGITLEAVGGNSNAFEVSEQFLLLLASGNYPDLITANWVNFPGGPTAAMEDGYIIPLNDYQENFPSLMQVYAENPDWFRMVQTDEGLLYNFPYLRGDPDAHHENGLVIRQDWLDELNMPLPGSIDELTETMRAMKENYNLASAFTFEMRWLWLEWAASSVSSAFSVTYPFYVVDGVVKFGPLEEGYREFMTQMASWYAEGLLDQDFPSINKATVQSKFANGDVGIAINPLNNTIACVEANVDTNYKVSGIGSIPDADTGKALFSQYYQTYDGSFGTGISTQCTKVEIACQFLDYLYSPEGRLFATYGQEGITYEIVDGQPQFTDLVMKNPEGITPGTVKGRTSIGANYALIREGFTSWMEDYAREIHAAWVNPNMGDAIYPPTTFTSIESQLVSRYYSTIHTYCQENMAQFITGQKNTEADYDAFIEQLKSYNVETVLEMYQAAYDRYMAR